MSDISEEEEEVIDPEEFYDELSDAFDHAGLDDPELLKVVLAAVPVGTYDGWVVTWFSSFHLGIDAMEMLGTSIVSEEGFNALFIHPHIDRSQLVEVIICAADQGKVALVYDLETLF